MKPKILNLSSGVEINKLEQNECYRAADWQFQFSWNLWKQWRSHIFNAKIQQKIKLISVWCLFFICDKFVAIWCVFRGICHFKYPRNWWSLQTTVSIWMNVIFAKKKKYRISSSKLWSHLMTGSKKNQMHIQFWIEIVETLGVKCCNVAFHIYWFIFSSSSSSELVISIRR